MFNCTLDARLRTCDLVKPTATDVASGGVLRTRSTVIQQKTGNLRISELLLGHRKLESTLRNLGVEVDDALELAERLEI